MSVHACPMTRLTPLAVLSLLMLSGCATKDFVQQEMAVVNSRIDALRESVSTASQRIDGNSVRLNQSDTRLARAERTATDLGGRIDDNLAGLAGANRRLDGLAVDLTATGERVAANAAEIARAHQRVDGLEEQVHAGHRRIEGTVAGLALMKYRLGGVESSVLALSQPGSDRLAALPMPATPPVETSPVPKASVADATSVLGDARSRLDGLAAQIANANQRIDSHSGAIDSMASRVGAVEKGLGETRTRTEAGEQALAAMNVRIDETRGEMDAARQKLAEQGAAIGAVDQRADALKTALDVNGKRLDSGDAGLAEASERLARLQLDLKMESERMTRHEADAAAGSAAFRHTLDGLGDALASANQRIDVVANTQTERGEHLARLRANLDEHGSRLDLSQTQMGTFVASIQAHEERMLRNETFVSGVSATAKEALERATAAGRLAEGKLLYETVLSEALANFDLEQARLSTPSKQALTVFADKLRAENRNVFIEIQGHTDDTGGPVRNQRLGRERAEAARAFLHRNGGIPLHRMAVISYGETRPVADNKTSEGRAQNRRVVLVVLR